MRKYVGGHIRKCVGVYLGMRIRMRTFFSYICALIPFWYRGKCSTLYTGCSIKYNEDKYGQGNRKWETKTIT